MVFRLKRIELVPENESCVPAHLIVQSYFFRGKEHSKEKLFYFDQSRTLFTESKKKSHLSLLPGRVWTCMAMAARDVVFGTYSSHFAFANKSKLKLEVANTGAMTRFNYIILSCSFRMHVLSYAQGKQRKSWGREKETEEKNCFSNDIFSVSQKSRYCARFCTHSPVIYSNWVHCHNISSRAYSAVAYTSTFVQSLAHALTHSYACVLSALTSKMCIYMR